MGMNKADSVTRERYADVLGENNDPATVRLVQDLERGYTSVTVPLALRSKPPRPAPGRLPELRRPGSTWADMPRRWRLHTKLYAALAVVVTGAILLATGATMAGPPQASITNLGPPLPVQSTNTNFPLSGFHRLTPALLVARGKPRLTFIGTQFSPANTPLRDSYSPVERWPVVKALDQFGSFSNISPATRTCYRDSIIGQDVCNDPTFDWVHARYRSRYLAFDHVDLLNQNGHAYQRPSKPELALYNRYVRDRHPQHPPNLKTDPYAALSTVLSLMGAPRFPLVAIDGYVQTSSQVTISGDFEEVLSGPQTAQGAATRYSGLPFDTVRAALGSGTDPKSTHLVENVNAEANIITALICHATKNQPKKVCTRPTIKSILKSVR